MYWRKGKLIKQCELMHMKTPFTFMKITQPRTSTFTASARTIKGRCIEMQTVREVVSQGESSALLRRELHYLSDTDRQALLNEAGVENAP